MKLTIRFHQSVYQIIKQVIKILSSVVLIIIFNINELIFRSIKGNQTLFGCILLI